MKSTQLPTTDNTPEAKPLINKPGEFHSFQTNRKEYIKERNLSTGQQHVVNKVFEYFKKIDQLRTKKGKIDFTFQELNDESIEPLQILITGDPGSGKSYASETICELASIMKLGFVATTSYNGIAAVNVDGNTICSMFQIHTTNEPLTSVEDLRTKLDANNMCFLIVDEISTIDTRIIALLDSRLQQIFNNKLPFGGVPIIFAGDFNQNGPVQKTFIPDDMIKLALCQQQIKQNIQFQHAKKSTNKKTKPQTPKKITSVKAAKTFKKAQNKMKQKQKEISKDEQQANKVKQFHLSKLHYLGSALFAKFKRFHLEEQQRSSDDNVHAAFVKKLSQGKGISLQDIKHIKHLSNQDIDHDPQHWKFATHIVSTNAERINISSLKAKLWAKEN